MFKISKVCRSFVKRLSTTPSHVIEQLRDRSIVRVSGEDASAFLQGLITNDVNHLNSSISCMFAMFLNSKGRVLYDTIIYRLEQNAYLLEVDAEISSLLQKHLNLYRIRKKVDIAKCDKYQVWAAFEVGLWPPDVQRYPADNADSKFRFTVKIVNEHLLLVFRDPRLSQLGYRVLASPDSEAQVGNLYKRTTEPQYRRLRYALGVGEGVNDLPPGRSSPLELNCDFLHGVSFHKGCYVGQELTARTHHTGTVRKRLMPLFFESQQPDLQPDAAVQAATATVGRLRGVQADTGLALLRVTDALAARGLQVEGHAATTRRPTWWPVEASHVRLPAKSSSS